MKRVAVFGNAGGGKSTLARHLAGITRLPLHVLDKLQFKPGGDAVPREEYLKAHAELLRQDTWIIDGYSDTASAWERFDRADALVYVDLPLPTHYSRVTTRLIQGLFAIRRAGQKAALFGAARCRAIRSSALPSLSDTEVPAACCRYGGVEARSSPQVAARDGVVPRCRQARICECLTTRA